MFKSYIKSTPFCTEAANDYFCKITGGAWEGDVSFLSTMRALIAPRMKEDDSICLGFWEKMYKASEIGASGESEAVRKSMMVNMGYEQVNLLDLTNRFTVCNFSSPDENNRTAWLDLYERKLPSMYEGWHRLDKVTVLFRKVFRVLCFVNPLLKSTIIFTDNLDIRKMHYLQVALLGCVPWYFSPQDGVTELEMALIESLREKTSEKYEECLDKLAEQYDFKTERVRTLLYEFEKKQEVEEMEHVRQELLNLVNEINMTNQRLHSLFEQQERNNIILLGLETKAANTSNTSDLMDYFLCNKSVFLEKAESNNTVITFGTKGYVTYFDEDMARRMIENTGSYIYAPRGRGCNNIIPVDDMKMLMTAIFVNQTVKLRFCAAFKITSRCVLNPITNYSYGSEYRDCTPNPHTDQFACLGSYLEAINELSQNRDYIGVIEQCIASCKSLNFGDSVVMSEFMSRLYGISDNHVNIRCIELPNGSVMSPKDAIEYLKQAEEEQDG